MFIRIILLTAVLEFITVVARIIFGSAYAFCARHRLPRVHHGYVGFLLLFVYIIYPDTFLFTIGAALVASDAIHHCIVLPFLLR